MEENIAALMPRYAQHLCCNIFLHMWIISVSHSQSQDNPILLQPKNRTCIKDFTFAINNLSMLSAQNYVILSKTSLLQGHTVDKITTIEKFKNKHVYIIHTWKTWTDESADWKMSTVNCNIIFIPVHWKKNISVKAIRNGLSTVMSPKSLQVTRYFCLPSEATLISVSSLVTSHFGPEKKLF